MTTQCIKYNNNRELQVESNKTAQYFTHHLLII